MDTPTAIDAAALIIKFGNVDKSEAYLQEKHGMEAEETQDLAAEGLFMIMSSAPREIRPSFDAVVSWHRWNSMYLESSKRGNMDGMVAAQKQMDALLARVH